MRLSARSGAWILAGSLVALSIGCVDTAGDVRDASSEGFTVEPPSDGAIARDAKDDGAADVTTKFRVVHLSNDLGAIDVCYRPTASQAWVGPLFADGATADAATAADAGVSEFRFGYVTRYVTARASGTFDIGLVAAGDASCGRPLALGQVTLDAGKLGTVVVMGLARRDAGSPGALAIASFTDDATSAPAAARARFIHAAVGGVGASPLSISAVTTGNEITLASRVDPGHAATPTESPPKIDAFGYGSAAPILANGAFRLASLADGGGPTWTTSGADLGMSAASIHSGFVFDASGSGDLAVLWCDDRGASEPWTPCAIVR
jgi:hypothetical protein